MKQDESLALRQERHKELYNVGGDKNLNKMENFKYTLEMGTIYRKCFETLKPGGTVGLIIKDRASKGRRVELSMSAVRAMFRAGFELHSWFKWDPPGQKQYETMHKERGHMWIDEEELIIMQKPEEVS